MSDADDRVTTAYSLLSAAEFEIGGVDGLLELHEAFPEEPAEADASRKLEAKWRELVTEIRIQTGTLLKTDTVSFLLGAGASRECGGPLMGSIPLEVERELTQSAAVDPATGGAVPTWLTALYLAASAGGALGAPTSADAVTARLREVESDSATELSANFESVLSILHRWRATMTVETNRLRLSGPLAIDVSLDAVDEALRRATWALATRCLLPTAAAGEHGVAAYRDFLRKVLSRPLNLKRANIFTLNYDTLVEQAADAEGVVLVDGFVGSIKRTFRPESYDHDLYFPAETTEGRVHRLDRVVHLYKLHGSVTWIAEEPELENPYGIRATAEKAPDGSSVLIYPTPTKWGEALGMPYAELLRRFAGAVVRPQSVLFVLGYGFGDEHIVAVVRQALAVPSFTLVIVDPNPTSPFVQQLRALNDKRVWVLSGKSFGTFSGFVEGVLADLQDESVRRKVMDTYRALGSKKADGREGRGTDE